MFSPLLQHNLPPTAGVGVIGIGGLGHMALQFANKWGYEVHAFTTSDSKEEEAHKLGAHQVHNTKRDDVLKKIAGSLDLIISTINVPLDIPGLLATLAPSRKTPKAFPAPDNRIIDNRSGDSPIENTDYLQVSASTVRQSSGLSLVHQLITKKLGLLPLRIERCRNSVRFCRIRWATQQEPRRLQNNNTRFTAH